jgi:Trk-type K+ transport system membrane component
MSLLLKIILGIISLASLFFGNLVIKEYKLFNRDIENKNTSVMERVLVNGLIFFMLIMIAGIFLFGVLMIFSKINIELPLFMGV